MCQCGLSALLLDWIHKISEQETVSLIDACLCSAFTDTLSLCVIAYLCESEKTFIILVYTDFMF